MDLQSRAAFVEAIKLPIPFLHAKNFEDMPLSSIPALVGISVLYTIGVRFSFSSFLRPSFIFPYSVSFLFSLHY